MTLDEAVWFIEEIPVGTVLDAAQIEAINTILQRNRLLEEALSETYESLARLGKLS